MLNETPAPSFSNDSAILSQPSINPGAPQSTSSFYSGLFSPNPSFTTFQPSSIDYSSLNSGPTRASFSQPAPTFQSPMSIGSITGSNYMPGISSPFDSPVLNLTQLQSRKLTSDWLLDTTFKNPPLAESVAAGPIVPGEIQKTGPIFIDAGGNSSFGEGSISGKLDTKPTVVIDESGARLEGPLPFARTPEFVPVTSEPKGPEVTSLSMNMGPVKIAGGAGAALSVGSALAFGADKILGQRRVEAAKAEQTKSELGVMGVDVKSEPISLAPYVPAAATLAETAITSSLPSPTAIARKVALSVADDLFGSKANTTGAVTYPKVSPETARDWTPTENTHVEAALKSLGASGDLGLYPTIGAREKAVSDAREVAILRDSLSKVDLKNMTVSQSENMTRLTGILSEYRSGANGSSAYKDAGKLSAVAPSMTPDGFTRAQAVVKGAGSVDLKSYDGRGYSAKDGKIYDPYAIAEAYVSDSTRDAVFSPNGAADTEVKAALVDQVADDLRKKYTVDEKFASTYLSEEPAKAARDAAQKNIDKADRSFASAVQALQTVPDSNPKRNELKRLLAEEQSLIDSYRMQINDATSAEEVLMAKVGLMESEKRMSGLVSSASSAVVNSAADRAWATEALKSGVQDSTVSSKLQAITTAKQDKAKLLDASSAPAAIKESIKNAFNTIGQDYEDTARGIETGRKADLKAMEAGTMDRVTFEQREADRALALAAAGKDYNAGIASFKDQRFGVQANGFYSSDGVFVRDLREDVAVWGPIAALGLSALSAFWLQPKAADEQWSRQKEMLDLQHQYWLKQLEAESKASAQLYASKSKTDDKSGGNGGSPSGNTSTTLAKA